MLKNTPHRRYNPLLGEWVLVSPERLGRPWRGRTEPLPAQADESYDPGCYLCPGNARSGGARNPAYASTFVFDNDYPALGPPIDAPRAHQDRLLRAEPEAGVCRVICYSPRHDASLARMALADLHRVVDVWSEQFTTLGALPWINHVAIFENRGAAMGASNPHPHGQIWATGSIPNVAAREQASFAAHRTLSGPCLLCEYLAIELERAERLVYGNDHFTVVVPFWAVWPYETMVLPRRHVTGLDELSAEERLALADVLQGVALRYDTLFAAPCAYSMGFHQRPTDGAAHPEWHLHGHVYPPVLRSATVHKFLVGFELLAMPQRDLTAEEAAARLRAALGAPHGQQT